MIKTFCVINVYLISGFLKCSSKLLSCLSKWLKHSIIGFAEALNGFNIGDRRDLLEARLLLVFRLESFPALLVSPLRLVHDFLWMELKKGKVVCAVPFGRLPFSEQHQH
jgi:hypothetical protein